MSAPAAIFPPTTNHEVQVLVLDDKRGTAAMALTIATETFLFVLLFFSYFFLAKDGWRWPTHEPPRLMLALIMLGILLVSSGVVAWGEKQVKLGNHVRGRMALVVTILMGSVFLVIQFFEYRNHLRTLTPQSNAYGSIFYTITSFHAAHVIVGMLMLLYVLLLPRIEPAPRPPHRPYHCACMYWHFVDIIWVFVVALLYVLPNLR